MRLKFIKGEWYRHTRFKNLIMKILDSITAHTYRVELFTIKDDEKNPVSLGRHISYFVNGDNEWEDYEP